MIIKNIIKAILPNTYYKNLSAFYRKFFKRKIPVHIKDAMGFDLYQNVNDIIDYSPFAGCSLKKLPNNVDTRIFQTINKYVTQGSVAIDIGANIGLMSLAMSKCVGFNGRVLSFEPGPVSYGLLRRNVYTNNEIGNIIISDQAVSDTDGNAPLFINPNGESDNQIHKNQTEYIFKNEQKRSKFDVETITIDSILKNNSIDFTNVSFVKIDTQGHDLEVMRGGKYLFKNSKKIAVLCEFAPYLKAWENISIDEFYDTIKSYDFDIYDDSNIDEGIVTLEYLKKNYGFDKISKYTDLLLLKGLSI